MHNIVSTRRTMRQRSLMTTRLDVVALFADFWGVGAFLLCFVCAYNVYIRLGLFAISYKSIKYLSMTSAILCILDFSYIFFQTLCIDCSHSLDYAETLNLLLQYSMDSLRLYPISKCGVN